MILGELKQWSSMKGLEGLELAFEFLEKNQGQELPLGRQSIQGEDVYAIIARMASRPIEEGKFESHRKYIDVQYLDAGMEMIGYKPVEQLKVAQPYEEGKDIEFYQHPEHCEMLSMLPGSFAVFFPGDGHLPNCHAGGEHQLSKIVVKVLSSFYKKK